MSNFWSNWQQENYERQMNEAYEQREKKCECCNKGGEDEESKARDDSKTV